MISHLDYLMSLNPISREIYGNDPDNKPNDHCVWRDVGYTVEMFCWVENDEHFRERIKQLTDSESV